MSAKAYKGLVKACQRQAYRRGKAKVVKRPTQRRLIKRAG